MTEPTGGPSGEPPAEPWSPFPVQDWSQLPSDPLTAAPVEGDRPAGSTGASAQARRPRRWLPVAVITAIAVLLTATTYAATTVADPSKGQASLRYLPEDGAASYARVQTTRELATSTHTEVTESARLSGYTALLSTDTSFGIKALGSVYSEGSSIRLWRTTATVLDDPAPDPTAATPQTTRIYRTNDGIQLLGESGPTEGYAYRPGLVELPSDVEPGHSWTSSGSAGDTLDYRSELRAEQSTGSCLRVSGTIRYASKTGQQQRVVGVQRTWCPGLGITVESQSFGDIAVQRSPITPPTDQRVLTTDTPIRWPDPKQWTAASYDTTSGNAVFGPNSMSGSTLSSVTPVRTASRLVVRAMFAPTDLVATTPKDAKSWTTTWRVHPGGTLLSLAAFGDVVVVTTSERRMVGYSDRGARLWQIELDELAPTAPLRVSDTDAVLVDLSGDARRFAVATGNQQWSHNVGSDVSVAPAAGAGLVLVADRSSTVTALDATTGEQRWTQQLDGTAVAVNDDTVVVVQDQTAHGLAASSGEHRWLRHFDGTLSRLVPFGDRFLLTTASGSVMIDRQGVVRATLGGYLDLTVTADLVVGWGKDRAEVVDPSGRVVSGWDIPSTTVVSELRPGLALPQGVVLFNLDWTFGTWTA